MDKIKVEITFKESKDISIYEVRFVYVQKDEINNIEYLVMSRLSDGGLGFIPMDIIESYKILE